MAVGKATRELSFEGDKEHIFEEIRSALATIGRVTEVDQPTFVRGRTRVGLQRVDVRVSIQERGALSVAQIEAFADDVWGAGAKMGIKKLLKALHEQPIAE